MTTMMLLESTHDSSQIVHRAVGGLSLYNTGATSLVLYQAEVEEWKSHGVEGAWGFWVSTGRSEESTKSTDCGRNTLFDSDSSVGDCAQRLSD